MPARDPIEILFNTSWRDEHTGSNEALGAAGTKIFAHENTKLWLGGDFDVDWENRHYAPRPKAALPTNTFYVSGALDFDGRKIEYKYLPRAHTDGDVAVFFPDANVLAAGSLVAVGRTRSSTTRPAVGSAASRPRRRRCSARPIARPRSCRRSARACGRAELEAQLALCTAVRERANDAYKRGLSFAEFVATKPTAEFDAQRGDPAQFLLLVHKGAFAHMRELGGVI